jgi:hypothetical protein
MALLPILVCTLFLTGGPGVGPQPAPAAASGQLRWVRGTIVTVSPESLSLQLRSNVLTVGLDSSTEGTTALSVGSMVDVHYSERRGIRRAVLIFPLVAGSSSELSKRPGKSLRGVVMKGKSHSLTMRVDARTRKIVLDSHTQLVDRESHPLASGDRAITPLIAPGDELLVKYEEVSNVVPIEGMYLTSDDTRAVEIRKLARR